MPAIRFQKYSCRSISHYIYEILRYAQKDALVELQGGIKKDIVKISFSEALEALHNETKDNRYKEFSLKHFGGWEEIMLTQIYNSHVLVTQFPMLQIPFYHKVTKKKVDGVPVAENADLVLHGYRETVGSGVRVVKPEALAEKAKIFNLPLADYEPYLRTRYFKDYKPTAGFGLGWQRLTHWLLKLPFIWETSLIPRGHTIPRP